MIINGKEAKFFWGSPAFVSYQNAVLVNDGDFSTFSVTSVSHMLWGGIMNYHQRLYEKCPLTFTEVYDHVEAIALSGEQNEELNQCIKDFNDSSFVKKALESLQPGDEKKNLTGKNLKKRPTKQG